MSDLFVWILVALGMAVAFALRTHRNGEADLGTSLLLGLALAVVFALVSGGPAAKTYGDRRDWEPSWRPSERPTKSPSPSDAQPKRELTAKDIEPAPPSSPARPASFQSKYIPNHVPLETRAAYLCLAALMVAYSVYSLVADNFVVWLPSRGRDVVVHLHGAAAWLAVTAVGCALAAIVSVFVDHHDQRDNESSYRRFAKAALVVAAALILAALMLQGYHDRAAK